MMSRRTPTVGIASAFAGVLALAPAVYAQAATSLEQAELAGLNPATRAEVQARMAKGGQKVEEVLTTILLNNIKLKHQASQIVAIDFDRGVAVVNEPGGTMHMYHFNTKTLEPS